jgi:hypothetical protein
VVAAIFGAIAVAAVRWPNTGTSSQVPQHEGLKAIYVAPRSVPLGSARGEEVLLLEQNFVEHAVFRRDVEQSFDLVSPDLRAGFSRARWATGEIPVEPYPAAAVKEIRGKLLYSYPEKISLQIRFVPKDGATVSEQNFDLVVQQFGPAGSRRWLVSSWLPSGLGGRPRAATSIDLRAQPAARAPLGAMWLALPGALVGIVLLLLVGLAARGWLRHRRAMRAFLSSRSSRP